MRATRIIQVSLGCLHRGSRKNGEHEHALDRVSRNNRIPTVSSHSDGTPRRSIRHEFKHGPRGRETSPKPLFPLNRRMSLPKLTSRRTVLRSATLLGASAASGALTRPADAAAAERGVGTS